MSSNPSAKLDSSGKIAIYNSFTLKEAIKGIPGRTFSAEKRAWLVPATAGSIELLKTMMPISWIDPEVLALYEKDRNVLAEVHSTKYADHVEPIAPMPIKDDIVPYQHQVKGYNMALKVFGY